MLVFELTKGENKGGEDTAAVLGLITAKLDEVALTLAKVAQLHKEKSLQDGLAAAASEGQDGIWIDRQCFVCTDWP